MTVVSGVERDLAGMPADLSTSGVAELARSMAARIDEGRGSPSECGKVLLEALAKLREMKPTEQKGGLVHDIRSGRARRLRVAGSSGSED
jgi:hypothetical protein